jgi:hypothetical protein
MRCWWHSLLQQGANDRQSHLQVIIYTIWNVWKERCHKVFQNITISPEQLAGIIWQDVIAYIFLDKGLQNLASTSEMYTTNY